MLSIELSFLTYSLSDIVSRGQMGQTSYKAKVFEHYMKCNEIVNLPQSKGQYDWMLVES